jgi:hypothetical protein
VVRALALLAVREQQHQLDCWPHFTSPEEMNSSTIDWAPLTKSPNCASHITSALGCSTE